MATRSVWRLEITHDDDISSTDEMTLTSLEEEIRNSLPGHNIVNLHVIEIEDVAGFWTTPAAAHFEEMARRGNQ